MTVRDAIFIARAAAMIHRPALVTPGGKLEEGEDFEDYIDVRSLDQAIYERAPYEASHPGCDDNLYTKLQDAKGSGMTDVIVVWDSGFVIAANESGQWTLIAGGRKARP